MSEQSCTIESVLAMAAVGMGAVTSRLSSCILRAQRGGGCEGVQKGIRSLRWQYLWQMSYPSLHMKQRPLTQLKMAQPGGTKVGGRQEKPFITYPIWHWLHTPADRVAQAGRVSVQLPVVREYPGMQIRHCPLGWQVWQFNTPTHPPPTSRVPNPQYLHSPLGVRMRHPEQSLTQRPPLVWKVGSQTVQAEALSCMRQLGTVSGRHEASVARTKDDSQRAHSCPPRQKRQWFGQLPTSTTISSRRGKQAVDIIQLMESQQPHPSPENIHEKTLLSQAGLMTLTKSQYQLRPKGQLGRQQTTRVLQQINNDDEFAPLANITTTYLPLAQTASLSPQQQLPHPPPTVFPSQYQKVVSQVRQTAQSSLSHHEVRRREKQARLEGEDFLGIEEIIGDIQRVMEEAVSQSRPKPSFKKDTQLVQHSRRHFQGKPGSKFPGNDSLFRLEEMLLNYQADSPLEPPIDPPPVEVTLRDASRRPRAKRNDKEPSPVESKPTVNETKKQFKQSIGKGEQGRAVGRKEKNGKLCLEDIEIMQLDWFKLPLLLGPLSAEGAQLAARMKDYPDHESFWTAILDSLPAEKQYNAYSIFNPSADAGLKQSRTLMSQEEFRQKWAEEWSQEIQEEEHKDLLCELDFQWYRSLVQATFSHTLEDILVKNLPYEGEDYRKALRTISTTSNDKNTQALPLPQLVTLNKLKYVEAFLDASAGSKGKKTLIAVIPNIALPPHDQHLSHSLKQAFIGELFAADSAEASMGVMLTRRQALACESGRWEGGRVQVGSVEVVVGEGEGKGDRILVSRARSKNSWIRLRVLRAGEEGSELQVGEELYQGRRYHILLD